MLASLLAVWIALGVAVVAVISSVGFALARALDAWRSFRRLRRTIGDAVGQVTRQAAEVERRAAAAGAEAARLRHAQAELEASLATARALTAAFGEFRALLARVTGLAPAR